MRSSLAFIIGAGSAMAQFTNSSMPTPVPTGAPDNNAFPSPIGDFKFLGCLTGTFPGFKLIASDDKMSLDLCAASCPSQIMGVVGKECFCADAVDSSASKNDDKSKCNIPCPGMPEQHCGGMLSKMKRADVVPAGSAMTAYMRDSSSSSSSSGNGGSTSKVSSKTVTSTYVSTITSCAPTVTNCPVGSKTHKVVVETIAVCPQPKWHAKKIECHSNHCAPEYACEGKHCKHERVICVDGKCHTEECNTNDWHKLVICKGKDCKYSQCKGAECDKKVVCYNGNCVVEQCYGKECDKNMVCKGDKCGWQSCKPGDASCKKEVTCNGDDCKVSPNPTGPMPAPGPKPTQNNNGQNNKGQNNNGQNNNGQNNKGQNNNGQNNNGQNNKGQNNNGQNNKGQNSNGQNNGQNSNGQNNKGQNSNGQNNGQNSNGQNNGQNNKGQNNNGQNKDTTVYGKPVSPTAIPVVAGGEKISFSVFAAVFGIFVMA